MPVARAPVSWKLSCALRACLRAREVRAITLPVPQEGRAVTLESTPYRLIQGGFGFAGRVSGQFGAIHYMGGGQIANWGVSQYEGLNINAPTDGEYQISAGAAPSINPRIH